MKKLHWLLSSQFGLDVIRFISSLRGLPQFFIDWWQFRKTYSGSLQWMPCLHDRYDEGGSTKDEYFWQDLLVARWIFEANPQKHVDIGSRVDGFVAHVASFRNVEVFDVRPISTQIPGITFKQADFMRSEIGQSSKDGYCDSLSCLHAIEHFGLGRYADPIDPYGHEKGIANMAILLKPGGTFYLSTPIGHERVEFNANRVFDPRSIIAIAQNNGLILQKLTVISGGMTMREVETTSVILEELSNASYNLGVFVFIKAKTSN